MNIYPYISPIVLTDNLFVLYGGQTGTTLSAQRSAAYVIAEEQASKYICTFLIPTIVTGSFPVVGIGRIATDYGYVSRILSAKILSKNNLDDCTLSETDSCVFIWDDTFGYMDMGKIQAVGSCSDGNIPYKLQLAYEAGLPTGVAAHPGILLALTIQAQINLNEMIYPHANESTGDVGVQSYRSLDYAETRVKMKRTILGTSAMADKVARLLDASVKKARRALII